MEINTLLNSLPSHTSKKIIYFQKQCYKPFISIIITNYKAIYIIASNYFL